METKTKTKLLGVLAVLAGAVLLSGCTQNFCSNTDKANMVYPYEQGVTVYCDKTDVPDLYASVAQPVFAGNDILYKYIPVDGSGNFTAAKSTFLVSTIIASANSSGYRIPSQQFFATIDQYVVETAVDLYVQANPTVTLSTISAKYVNPYVEPDTDSKTSTQQAGALRLYGYEKFYGSDDTWFGNWNSWNQTLKFSTAEGLGLEGCPDSDFAALYQSTVTAKISSTQSCIAIQNGNYGHFGTNSDWEVAIQQKDWGYAWNKGALEGLFVYPIAYLIDSISYSFDPLLTGVGQIWAIVLVTLIVRGVLLAATFKSTMSQQKIQALQPDIAKIQGKYPNSNTNNAEKQRLNQETAALYKRNKVNPAGMFVVVLIQLPIFITVWGAMQGSSVLSSGAVLNLRLSDSIQAALFNFSAGWAANANGWWTALILFVVMSVVQFLAMMLPQWITKARNKKLSRLTKNPAADNAGKQMKWVSIIMLAVTIFMGFTLPAAMGVYWAISAFISMLQTVITQVIMAHQANKKKGI